MKRFLTGAAAFVLAVSLTGEVPVSAGALPPVLLRTEENAAQGEQPRDNLELSAPSALLLEAETGGVIYEKNADERRPPASITKIMTLLLIFEELERGGLKLEELVTASANAKSMGGSQVYLEEGEQQDVDTMIKCIVVSSGNDASVAMAEHIAGSEGEFVARMNARAEELGLSNTHFEDCCGLSESENHYTTARDVALLSRELITRFPQVLSYSSIWMDTIVHSTAQGSREFGLSNTNKMLRTYEGCVGLKTGSTSRAKFCVSSVAERNGIMLIAVVMGAPESKGRFADAAAMLNYGFGKCSVYTDENQDPLPDVSVSHASVRTAECAYREPFTYLDVSGADLSGIEKKITVKKEVRAPVKAGDPAGSADYYLNGEKIGSVELLFTQSIDERSFAEALGEIWEAYLGGGIYGKKCLKNSEY